jgi:hypothetical protein
MSLAFSAQYLPLIIVCSSIRAKLTFIIKKFFCDAEFDCLEVYLRLKKILKHPVSEKLFPAK